MQPETLKIEIMVKLDKCPICSALARLDEMRKGERK
jgi:hypothetical protein